MPITNANLKWYYSGGASNSDPALSLGGIISSVEVTTSIHGLFDRVSGAEASTGDTEYRCIYFKNTDADADGLIDPAIFIQSQTSSIDTAVEIGLDPAGKSATATSIAVEGNAPAGVTFSAPSTYETGLVLPTDPYLQNAYIGLWIKRVVDASAEAYASDACTIRVQGDTV
jgi:hypothetical protein